jgi:hypothetical protein
VACDVQRKHTHRRMLVQSDLGEPASTVCSLHDDDVAVQGPLLFTTDVYMRRSQDHGRSLPLSESEFQESESGFEFERRKRYKI